MDIDRLMQDLSVADLQRIYSDLTVDLEGKKEELRQMVGRRYRDVLDASSSAKKVTENAEIFANKIRDLRTTLSDRSYSSSSPHRHNCKQYMQLTALNKLYPLIGTMDPLSDVFVLMLVESIHRSLSVEVVRSEHGIALIKMMSPKLIRLRLSFKQEFVDGLGKLDSPEETANQLAAIAVLNKLSVAELLDMFLDSKTILVQKAASNSSSITDTVWSIRYALECVQKLFLDGHLVSVLRNFYTFRWISGPLEQCINDEPLSFGNCLRKEIKLLAESCTGLTLDPVEETVLKAKCSSFLEKICAASRRIIEERCSLFESTSGILEFLTVLLEAFNQDWPVVGDSEVLYQKLFQNLILDRFKHLVKVELSAAMQSFLSKIPTINCHPPQFFKKRPVRFEPLLAASVSEQLINQVEQFDANLQNVYANVQKYESYGKEEDVSKLHNELADAVVEMMSKLCKCNLANAGWSVKEHALTMTRMYLALLRPRNSVVSLCLAGNNEKIVECVNLLQETAEKHFCCFLNAIMIDCAGSCDVKKIADICTDPFTFLSFIQEYEKMDIPEVGVVEVPIQITYVLYDFLCSLCSKICANSLGCMLTRRIRTQFNEILGTFLVNLYDDVLAKNKTLLSRIALQYLFDVRVLDFIFASGGTRRLIPQFEALADPFDLSIVNSTLTKNARIAAQRYSVLFGPHFGETFSTKELTLSPSYAAVLDIVPRVGDVPRFTLIPRLTKSTKESSEPLRTVASALNINSRRKITRQGEGVKNTPSLSSLYNWFGK